MSNARAHHVLSLPVIHEAHTYGAVGGALAALWFVYRSPRPASL